MEAINRKKNATYSANADLLRDLLLGIDIDLVEADICERLGQLLENGRDDLAGPAPRRPEVDYNDLITVDL